MAVFSHGTAIRQALARIKGIPPEEWHGLRHSDNTAVSCLKWDGAAFQLAFEGGQLPPGPRYLHTGPPVLVAEGREAGGGREPVVPAPGLGQESQTYYEARREAWITVHGEDTPLMGESFLQDARLHCGRTPWG